MYTIKQLSDLAGITRRTLHYYDEIGLFVPTEISGNGYRWYSEQELLRLQQILLLRNLGLGLETIADVLERDSREGTVAVLRRHRRWLVEERDRLRGLLHTIDRTIDDIEEGRAMTAESMFEGFAHNPYEDEARERWGDQAVDASKERMKGWSTADAEKARTGYGRVHEGLAPLLAEGVAVDDVRVQDLVQLHYELTSLFWTPNAEAYRGLAQMYVDDQRFTANIGQGNDALVAYLRDAMLVYADARLS